MKTQIIELEKKYWHGIESHDYDTVKKLTHFPCIIAGKSGVQSVDEATFSKMFESGKNKIKVFGFSDIEVQSLSENSAITAYQVELGMADNKEGRGIKCACTSAWVKQNENWMCVLHTETELAQQ